MTDIAANKSPDVKARDIFAARLSESAQNIVRKMRGGGRKRRRLAPVPATAPKRQRKTNTDGKRAVRAQRKKRHKLLKEIFA
jgi:hypothetical protein